MGETCVSAALRGPHLFPLFAGGDIDWTADESLARAPVTGGPRTFNVLGFDGESHGQIVTGVDGVTSDPRGFVGKSYFIGGGGPCAYPRPDGSRVASLGCSAAGGCGISVAIVGYNEPPSVAVAYVCVSHGSLIGDFDGDGAPEAFEIEGLRGQGAVDGVPHAGSLCAQPHFAWYGIPVGADVLDVLGAADLDHDGHLDLMIAYTPARGKRTVALYAPATAQARRLDLRATVPR